ncbi:unnamed protein product [Moneuplotes crassus]|uniref:Bactericidal permeability-increasing protein n=1 Tax=Euplotes crassus TaxID=5936 RepID=A0AAD1UPL8_EUPCR|nr:unnamed protein product [Moneuplotes crassus]
MLVHFASANNPGLVAVIKRDIIDKVRDQYFDSVFQELGELNIPDVDAGDMKITQIKAALSNGSPENLITSFHNDINAVGVELKETVMDVNVNWKYKKTILSLSGTAHVKGTIQDLGLNVVMNKLVEDQYAIPQINVQDVNVGMDKSKFDLNLKCSGCPGEVEKWISGIMKGQLLDEIQSQIRDQVPAQANTKGNDILKEQYPRSYPLYNNIAIATALTDSIDVQDDHLEILLDGTFFPHDQGYKRPSDASEMPHYNPNDPGHIMMFISSYLVDTLSSTIGVEKQTYDFTILGISYQFSLDPAAGKTSLSFEDGDFIVQAVPTIVASDYGVGISIGGSVKLDPSISAGDETNMLSVTPSVKGLTLSSLQVITPSQTYDLSSVAEYANVVAEAFLNWLVVPTIGVKKQEVLPLTVVDSELDFHKDYSEVGLKIEFA